MKQLVPAATKLEVVTSQQVFYCRTIVSADCGCHTVYVHWNP